MKCFVTVFALATMVSFSVCRKNLVAHEDTEKSVFDYEKGLADLSKSVSESEKLDVHEKMKFPTTTVKKNVEDNGRVIFPTEPTSIRSTEKTKIPESLLIAMNDILTADEFLRRFVARESHDSNTPHVQHTEDRGSTVLGRKGLSGGMGSQTLAEFAGCRPQKTVLKIMENPENEGILLWPPCVYLNRCGGCCISELMTCRPTAVSLVNVTVLQTRYTGPQSNPFTNDGMRVITMEQHNKCACGCKELPQDCTPRQEYRKNECRCICANQNEATRCKEGPNKFWDSRDCMCKCRDPMECSSGLFFNIKTCRCEALRFSLIARIGSIVQAGNETIEAHNETQPIRQEIRKNIQHK